MSNKNDIPRITPNKTPDDHQAQVSSFFQLLTNSALLSRAQLAASLGYSYQGDRDIYQALGYDTEPTWTQYVAQYERQGFARAIIDRPVAATWGRGFQIVEAGDDEDTELEKAWRDLERRLGLTSMFARLDRLTGLGTYGVLLLGLSDVTQADDFRRPVRGTGLRLNYVRPFSGTATEGDAQVQSWVTDTTNERYGRPEHYRITLRNLATGDSRDLYVHHTRIIHVADGLGSSEIEGTPRLQAVWNNLKNLEKIMGGSAEMYWRGARPGYQFNIDKDFQMTPSMRDTLQDVFDEYEHNLRRILELQGGKLEPLATQVEDPTKAVEVQIQEMCAVSGIPKRVLTGSERGELASTQDRENQADYVEDRQLNFAEARVIRPSMERLMELGILPEESTEEGFNVQWPNLREPSDQDKAKLWETRANAIAKYASSAGSEAVIPIQSFLRMGGFDQDEITLIEEEKEAQAKEEAEAPELQEEPPQQPTAPGQAGSQAQPQGGEVATNPNQPAAHSNPCHNPAGAGGGQFCGSGSSSGSPGPGRNLSDAQVRQRVLDDRLVNEFKNPFAGEPVVLNTNGMTVQDRIAYVKELGLGRPEFSFNEPPTRFSGQIPKGLDAAGLRTWLSENGKVGPADQNRYHPLATRSIPLAEVVKGMSSAEKDEFVATYPKAVREITDGGGRVAGINMFHEHGVFNVSQAERMADGFDAHAPGGRLGVINYLDKYSAVAADFAQFSANREFALSELVGGWATTGSGQFGQQIVHQASKGFSENQGISFYDGFASRPGGWPKLAEGSYSHDRMAVHVNALRQETESFYRAKLGRRYDTASVTLYRGIAGHVEAYTPSPAESWSTAKSTGERFGKQMSGNGAYSVIATKVPMSKILWTYESVAGKYRWPPEKDLRGKKEHVVIGGAINSVQVERK